VGRLVLPVLGLKYDLSEATSTHTWSPSCSINKRILVDLHFTYPITVAWMGLFTTTLCSWVAVRTQVGGQGRT
jgi:hypothetical protein